MQPIKLMRGSALLTALFIMTLVAIVATAMSTKLQVDIYRTRLTLTHDKLYLASQGVAFWALGELNNKKKKFTQANPVGMVLTYPKKLQTIYPSVTLTGELYDLQALANLNNLSNKKALLAFMNLVNHVAPKAPGTQRVNVLFAINDWVSPYNPGKGKDYYLSYYLNQKPPYYPSHQFISSRSELRLVKGVTADFYEELAPFITALPEITAVNINTASAPALMSLSHLMNGKKANEMIASRGKNGINHIEKIKELLTKLNISPTQITFESVYYLSVAQASTDNSHLTVYTLLKRDKDKKGKLSVSILRESLNVF